MSLESGYKWHYKDLKVVGYTLAGTTTSFVIPAASVAIDVAQGLPFQLRANNFLITHGHMDHASGIPYIISQKNMVNKMSPKLYMLPAVANCMEEIMSSWAKIEKHRYDYQIIPVELHKTYKLEGDYSFRAFESYHRVPCIGYTIFKTKKQLKQDYRGLESHEIKNLKNQGTIVEEIIDVPEFTYTGDTKSEVLTEAPDWALKSRVFAMEVSFMGPNRTIENSREWGHIHWDEVIPHIDRLQCEKLLVVHLSARHKSHEFNEMVRNTVPEKLRDKIALFPRPV